MLIRHANGLYCVNESAVSDRNEGIAYGVLLALLSLGSLAASALALAHFVAR